MNNNKTIELLEYKNDWIYNLDVFDICSKVIFFQSKIFWNSDKIQRIHIQ